MGLLAFRITHSARESLDIYEFAYTRAAVQVEIVLMDGEETTVNAETYIWKDDNANVLTELDENGFAWSFERYCDYT